MHISNDAYTIIANFDGALSVTIPIYTWGEYTITSDGLSTRTIDITSAESDYDVTMYLPTVIYNHGWDNTDITGGWYIVRQTASIGESTLNVYSSVKDGTYQGVICTNKKIDVAPYTKMLTEYSEKVSGGGPIFLSSKSINAVIGHDISKITTPCYVGIYAINQVGWGRCSKIELIK